MDNLAEAIELGYITEKEAKLLELLDMPAGDAKPPKGVPKTHVPKKDGKTFPKEKLKKLTPKQKATLKAKTDGKVDKTKDGIDTFFMEASTTGSVKDASPSQSNTKTSNSTSTSNAGGEGGRTGESGMRDTVGSNAPSSGPNNSNSRDDGMRGSVGSNAPSKGPNSTNSRDDGMRGPVGSNAPSQSPSNGGSFGRDDGARDVVGTPGNVTGKTNRENVTTINQNGSIAYKDDPDHPYGQNTTDISKTAPADLDNIVGPVTAPERALAKQVKQPTTFTRIDSPSSLSPLGLAASAFETPMADRPGMYSPSELSNIVGGTTPTRSNPPTRESYADNVASDPTAGRTNDSLAALAGNPEKDLGRIAQDNTFANNHNAYRSPPSQGSIDAARAAIMGDVAQAAGTPTAPYNPAPPSFPASNGRYGLPEVNPAVYSPPVGGTVAMNAPPVKTPSLAQAAGTITTPYNPTGLPDSPLSPLATAKPRALGADKYGSNTSLASLAMNAPANENSKENYSELGNDTIADQSLPGGTPQGSPNNSPIADQSLPGGLPSTRTPPATGQGGQGNVPGGDQSTVTPTSATPPAAVPEAFDPYAGIMPWDRIAYDAIKTSYEGRGQTYTPQQFITSFYNQRIAA